MAALSVAQLEGVVNATLSKYGRRKITDIASDLQEYVVMGRLMKSDKVVTKDGGKDITFFLTATLGSNARHVGMYSVDAPNVTDSQVNGTVPWRFTECSYSFDVHEKEINGATAEQLIELIKLREGREMAGLAELMETTFWGPLPASTDTVTPFGLKYWVVATTGKGTEALRGFNGGNPSGFTAGAAGIDSDTYTNWKNWAGNYTSFSREDLLTGMRQLSRETRWKSPIDYPNYDKAESGPSITQKFGIYVNGSTQEQLRQMMEDQNDNLGQDLGGGNMTFNGSAIQWIPYLDGDTLTDPIYFVNWGVFGICCLKGEKFRSTTMRAPNQHNVLNGFTDLSNQTICTDRRKCGILTRE